MKTVSLLILTALLLGAKTVSAQKDTAHHRAVYDTINNAQASMQKVIASHKDEATEFALTGYFQNGEVRKIVSLCGDDGSGPVEYYLEKEKPLFVYSTWYQTKNNGKRGAKVEERLYFKDGEIFKWLTTEKPAPVFHGEDYQATTAMHTANCAAFVAALKKAVGNTSIKEQANAKVTEGTFTGIQEGDYLHWNMMTKSGAEVSYFILHPDPSLEQTLKNPKSHFGKACRVRWKKTTETIPEAGGKLEIEQILSVEWLTKN